jgi:hypothetical protein
VRYTARATHSRACAAAYCAAPGTFLAAVAFDDPPAFEAAAAAAAAAAEVVVAVALVAAADGARVRLVVLEHPSQRCVSTSPRHHRSCGPNSCPHALHTKHRRWYRCVTSSSRKQTVRGPSLMSRPHASHGGVRYEVDRRRYHKACLKCSYTADGVAAHGIGGGEPISVNGRAGLLCDGHYRALYRRDCQRLLAGRTAL